MPLGTALHQKSGEPERNARRQGAARRDSGRDEAGLARHETEGLGRDRLLTQALARENMERAWKRVKANRGSAGVDGLTVEEAGEYLKTCWPQSERSGRRTAALPAGAESLLPPRRTPSLMTSTSRTARCGPACRVVWEGTGQVS